MNGKISARRLGMRLFLLSLGILFGACLIGYLVVRFRAEQWPPPGSPELPSGLWLSTAILVVLSMLLVVAGRSSRAGSANAARAQLAAATALGIAFLGAQVSNWMGMAGGDAEPRLSLFAFGFWVLTFLHAVHVVGGLIPLMLTTMRIGPGRYSGDPEPVELVASYWHFLGITWIVIFVVLMV
jgi:cytochrome c oxidase subunit 3